MRFNALPVPAELTAGYLARIWRQLATSINQMDETNFPHPLDGKRLIRSGTLSLGMLDVSGLHIPLLAQATAFNTASTTPVTCSGYFRWDPAQWPSDGFWYLEATAWVAGGIGTLALHGTQDWTTITVTNTAAQLIQSSPIAFPATAENVWLTLKSSSASYAASVLSASLVFAPV